MIWLLLAITLPVLLLVTGLARAAGRQMPTPPKRDHR